MESATASSVFHEHESDFVIGVKEMTCAHKEKKDEGQF